MSEHPFIHNLSISMTSDVQTRAQNLLKEVIEAVEKTKKKGKFTLTLEILPKTKVDGAVLEIRPTIKADPPQDSLPPTVAYATPENTLTTRDPRQHEITYGGDESSPLDDEPDDFPNLEDGYEIEIEGDEGTFENGEIVEEMQLIDEDQLDDGSDDEPVKD